MADQIFGPTYFKESWHRDVFILDNNIFAKKQVLFDICGLMQSQQSSYQSE